MLKHTTQIAPLLQAPGKGLPRLELFIARILVGWQYKRTTRSKTAELFEFEKNEIVRLARGFTSELGSTQVLINRLKGLEDSSRYWSIYMTVDHLRIVNQGMMEIITLLARGEKPDRVVRTADVKPRESANQDVVNNFVRVSNDFQETVSKISDLKTTAKCAHPWFGEFDADQWYFMAAFHMRLHRKQILSIKQKLAEMN